MMTDQELKDLVASLAVSQKETTLGIQELREAQKETDRQMKETDRHLKETDRQIRELSKQIGGLGNKFGDFAEGMALPSLQRIFEHQFRVDQFLPGRRYQKGGEELELELVGAVNGQRRWLFAAEVKSRLTAKELEKFLGNLQRFFHFLPQFKGYRLYGVLVAVDCSQAMEREALAQGIYLVRPHGDIFRLKVPRGFKAKDFSA